MKDDSFCGRRVTVMGLGRFGGGAGAVAWLLTQGARVTLTDLRSEVELADSLADFDRSQLAQLVLGRHRDEDFSRAEIVVVNPAVKPGNRFVELARAAGARITSEMELFWERCPAKIAAVTGTVGKSTTTTLLFQLLSQPGVRTWLGGNIGVSLLPQVAEIGADDWVVLELSSFQLAGLRRLRIAPAVAVVTNLFPNHLDWHPDWEDYRRAKQVLTENQSPDQATILNADDPQLANWPGGGQRVWFGTTVPAPREGEAHAEPRNHGRRSSGIPNDVSRRLVVILRGNDLVVRDDAEEWTIESSELSPALGAPHMLANAAAAIAAAIAAAMSAQRRERDADSTPQWQRFREHVRRVVAKFTPLPHRLERVGEFDGRIYVDDSKATTPEAAIAALQSFDAPLWLIAGGKDKGVDLSEFARVAAVRSRGVALIGETSAKLSDLLRSRSTVPVVQSDSLAAAVAWCREQSSPGEIILLSPACASDGEFANYEQRGERFRELAAGRMKDEHTGPQRRRSPPA